MSGWIDVTRPYDELLPTWPGRERPAHHWEMSIAAGDRANVSFWQLNAHSGTHMDAPLHFVAGGLPIDRIPPEVFIGPCRVVELDRLPGRVLDAQAARQLVGVERLLVKTEYSRPQPPDHYQPHPGLMTLDAAQLLLAAGLVLVGTDRLSVDDPSSEDCPLHYCILGAGCVIIEGLWLAAIEPGQYDLCAAPLRLTGTEASPVRALLKRGAAATPGK